jgi:uncharacterized iron-regulated membrane protein
MSTASAAPSVAPVPAEPPVGVASGATAAERDRVLAARSRGFRVCLWLHRWCGLVATPFFLVVAITGSLLVFHHEIQVALGELPTAAPFDASRPSAPIASMVEAARARDPSRVPVYALRDEHTPEFTVLGLVPPERRAMAAAKPMFFGTMDGAFLQAKDLLNDTFMGFVLRLHATWLAGLPGTLFGGLIALLVLVALITGVVVYSPFVRRVAFGEVRRERGARTSQLDWHNFIGVVVLGWAIAVSTTGALLSVGSLALKVWRMTELKAMTAPYAGRPVPTAFAPVDRAVEAAAAVKPGRRFFGVMFPGSEFTGDHHYGVFTAGTSAWSAKLFEIVLVDAATGEVTEARPTPWYLQTIMLSEPLHFGDYGGWPLQILWFVSTWLTTFIVGNGAWLWWARRRAASRAPPSGRSSAVASPAAIAASGTER